MNTVFIFGSRNIPTLPDEAIKSLDKIIERGMHILIGDRWGVDSLVQWYLMEKGYHCFTVFHTGKEPRNMHGDGMTKRVVGIGNVVDVVMSGLAEFGLAITDDVKDIAENVELMAGKVKVIEVQPAKTETIAICVYGVMNRCNRCKNTRLKLTFGQPCPMDTHVQCGMEAGKSKNLAD